MKNSFFLLLLGIIIFCSFSCKTEFEKLRETADLPTLLAKAGEFYEAEEYQKAQTLYESVLGSIRGRSESEQSYFNYANTHFKLERYSLSSFYFKDFANKFRNSKLKEEAEFLSALSNYKQSPSYRLDQTNSIKAIADFELFVNTYPQSERVAECNKLIDQMREKLQVKAYAQGELYFNTRYYESAVTSFENLLKDFPEIADAEKVRYMVINSLYQYATNSVVIKQPERFTRVVDKMDTFRKKYPKSRFDKELREIVNTTNRRIKELRNEGYKI